MFFKKGDKNITRRLQAELKYADWELLILHYLGLDHIGHVEGPYSPRVPGKLQEMDNVAMRINLELLDWVFHFFSLVLIKYSYGNLLHRKRVSICQHYL